MNIIFLDIDGVLNSRRKLIEVYKKTHRPHSGFNYPFDEKCLINLQTLVKLTNSKIVITSTWRKEQEGRETLLKALKDYNIEQEVIGYTPVLNSTRGEEIKEYLKQFVEIPNFIIIDDDSDMEELIDRLVLTNGQVGLTQENIDKGISLLSKKI